VCRKRNNRDGGNNVRSDRLNGEHTRPARSKLPTVFRTVDQSERDKDMLATAAATDKKMRGKDNEKFAVSAYNNVPVALSLTKEYQHIIFF